jgi:3-oxoacyl-[acyl-carrier-protein] synthase-3
MKHLAKKCGLPEQRVPFVLDRFGNSGGPSVALALTQGAALEPRDSRVMLLGYGVGLSWGAAIATLDPGAVLLHGLYTGKVARS